jgi:hypothetical protein
MQPQVTFTISRQFVAILNWDFFLYQFCLSFEAYYGVMKYLSIFPVSKNGVEGWDLVSIDQK